MTRWVPAKADIIGEFADEILHNYRGARAVIGVDGVPGGGQSEFADELAQAFRDRGETALRSSAGSDAEQDASAFLSSVQAFRAATGEYEGEGPALLVVDGTRLHSSALLPVFAYTIWITIPDRSDASDITADAGQAAYQHTAAPRTRATANVNNSDPEHPRRTFADSC